MQPTIDSIKMQTNIEFNVLNSWKHSCPKSNQALRRQSWINLDTMWTNLTILKICPVNVFVVFQSLSYIWLFVTPWTAAPQASLFFTISWSLLKLLSIESMMPSHPVTLVCCPQSFPASGSFPMNWLIPSGGQSIGASASASVLPVNIQG